MSLASDPVAINHKSSGDACLRSFNTASQIYQTKIVNYTWLNKERFSPGHSGPKCGVPLHYIDKALENAKRYPEASVIIWLDGQLLDQDSLDIVAAHIGRAGLQNVYVEDLNQIQKYRDNPVFSNGSLKPVPWRADLARLLAVEHCLKDSTAKDIFYADFDVDDLLLRNIGITNALDCTGFAGAGSQHEILENSYFGLRRTDAEAVRMFEDLVRKSCEGITGDHETRYSRDRLFYIFCRSVQELYDIKKCALEKMTVLAVRDTGYILPGSQVYADLGLN